MLLLKVPQMLAELLKVLAIVVVLVGVLPVATLVLGIVGVAYYLGTQHLSKRVSYNTGMGWANASVEQTTIANEFLNGSQRDFPCGREGSSVEAKYQFGAMLADASGLSMSRVVRGSINAAPMAADCPKDMSLSSARFEATTGLHAPGCLPGLQRFFADRDRPLSARFDAIEDAYPTVVI
jgi:hypothetical protein